MTLLKNGDKWVQGEGTGDWKGDLGETGEQREVQDGWSTGTAGEEKEVIMEKPYQGGL